MRLSVRWATMGKWYERMATTMTGWLARLITFYPPGTFDVASKQTPAKKRVPAKLRRTKKPSAATDAAPPVADAHGNGRSK